MEDYFAKLVVGYRFNPTSQELIDYLYRKVSKLPMSSNRIPNLIHLLNFHPQQLTSMYKMYREKELYFFTTISNMNLNDHSRDNRSAVPGLWVATGVKAAIYDDKGIKLGTEKTSIYYEKAKDNNNFIQTDWIMKQYTTEVYNANKDGLVAKEFLLDRMVHTFLFSLVGVPSSRFRFNTDFVWPELDFGRSW